MLPSGRQDLNNPQQELRVNNVKVKVHEMKLCSFPRCDCGVVLGQEASAGWPILSQDQRCPDTTQQQCALAQAMV